MEIDGSGEIKFKNSLGSYKILKFSINDISPSFTKFHNIEFIEYLNLYDIYNEEILNTVINIFVLRPIDTLNLFDCIIALKPFNEIVYNHNINFISKIIFNSCNITVNRFYYSKIVEYHKSIYNDIYLQSNLILIDQHIKNRQIDMDRARYYALYKLDILSHIQYETDRIIIKESRIYY